MSTPQICPHCEGTGWKRLSGATAKAPRVVRCDCRLAERSERLLKMARIPRRYEHCTFEAFDIESTRVNWGLVEARMIAEHFVRDYPVHTDGRGLLFIGNIGTGKTHLAVSVLRQLIETKGVHGLFYDYRELLKEIQNSYNASVSTTELEILRPVFDAEVLVLDELGAVKPTEWVWDTVSHILNTRYNDKCTTIITTNYPDAPAAAAVATTSQAQGAAVRAAREETLGDRIGERMRSRLHEMCRVVEMAGSDFRQRVGRASFQADPR